MFLSEKMKVFFKNTIKNLILGISIAIIFLLIWRTPFLYWIIPVYKEKKLKYSKLSDKIIVNLIGIIAIAAISIDFILLYIVTILSMEILYKLLNIKKLKLFTIDKIFIMTLIMGGIVAISAYSNLDFVIQSFSKEEIAKVFGISIENVEQVLNLIKDKCIYISMVFMSINSFMIYYIFEKHNFFNWKVSYLWLVPYIVFFTIEKFILEDNLIAINLLEVCKIVYIIYFIKILAKTIDIKTQMLSVIVGGIIAMNFPWLAFSIGGLASGFKKVENRRR